MRLKELLKKHHISQQQLANAIGYSKATVNQILKGEFPKRASKNEVTRKITNFLTDKNINFQQIETAINELRQQPKAEQPPKEDKQMLTQNNALRQETILHFGLRKHPFKDDIQCDDDIYLTQEQIRLREYLASAIHGCMTAITGEIGTGKTTIKNMLHGLLDENTAVIELPIIDKAALTGKQIAEQIYFSLVHKQPTLSWTLNRLSLEITERLQHSAKQNTRHILFIDDAHRLPKRTISTLKQFYELGNGYSRLLGIILIGQPELRNVLNARRSPDLSEIAHRFDHIELKPMSSREEVAGYIQHKLSRQTNSGKPVVDNWIKVIEQDAIPALLNNLIRKTNKGTSANPNWEIVENQCSPLMINNILTAAMNEAAMNSDIVNADYINMVWGAE